MIRELACRQRSARAHFLESKKNVGYLIPVP